MPINILNPEDFTIESGLSEEWLQDVADLTKRAGENTNMRYPLHRQGDYGATIEFTVQRVRADYEDREPDIIQPGKTAREIGENITIRDKPSVLTKGQAVIADLNSTFIRGGIRVIPEGTPTVGSLISNFFGFGDDAEEGLGSETAAGDDGAQIANTGTGATENGESPPSARQLIQDKHLDESTRISLYLPAGLVFNDGVTYDNVNIGLFGLGAERNAGEGDGVGAAIQGIIDGVSQLKGTKAGATQLAKLAQLETSSKFLGKGITSGLSGALRVKANPHTRVLFGSVPIRTFEFSFTFIPSSLKEAEAVHNIIRSFRTEVYPEGIALAKDTYYGYRYPDTYQIQFLYNGEQIQDAPQLLDCYLQSVNTNYNPNEMAFHKLKKATSKDANDAETGKDVKFSEITMTLSFTEERALFRKDIVDQYEGKL